MRTYELMEYRPNRWVKVDIETGAVIGVATPQEVEEIGDQPGTFNLWTLLADQVESSASGRAPPGGKPSSSPAELPATAKKTAPPGAQQPTPSKKKASAERLQGNGRAWPLEKRCPMTSSFQAHKNRTPPSKAPGIDLACPVGTEVRAWAAGRVTRSRWSKAGGRSLWIDHGKGLQTYYAHLNSVHVLEGETVSPGQKIGESGNTGHTTGPHLHFSVIKRRQFVDPDKYLRFDETTKT